MSKAKPKELTRERSATGSAAVVDLLFQGGEEVTYHREELIMQDGKMTDDIFRIKVGQVRVEKGDRQTIAGQGAVVNHLGASQTFGEMSFLDSTVPCANCIADSDEVTLLRVSKAQLAEQLASDETLSAAFHKQMAIAVTQRLQTVSNASAEITEAPRGVAQVCPTAPSRPLLSPCPLPSIPSPRPNPHPRPHRSPTRRPPT